MKACDSNYEKIEEAQSKIILHTPISALHLMLMKSGQLKSHDDMMCPYRVIAPHSFRKVLTYTHLSGTLSSNNSLRLHSFW